MGVVIIAFLIFVRIVDASIFYGRFTCRYHLYPLGNFDDYHVFKPKIEVWKEEKCNRFKDDGSFTTSFDDNGTIERIQQLLENLDQRG